MNPGRQRDAIIHEWEEAVEDGNLELANRIAAANPDLFGATSVAKFLSQPRIKAGMTCRECGAAVSRHMTSCPSCSRTLDEEPTPVRSSYSLDEAFLSDMMAVPVGHAVQIMDGLTGEAFYLQKITREAFQAAYDAAAGA